MDVPEEYGGGGVEDFAYNLIISEEMASAGAGGAGLGVTLHNDVAMPYFRDLTQRRTEATVAAGDLLGRGDHRHRHDRARDGLRSGVDGHDGDPRRRRLRRQRLEDVHHQRHQRRPRDHRRQDRPVATPPRHVADRDRARHGRLRARPQPRQDRHALAGHRRAVLQRRPRAGGEPARRGGRGFPPARDEPAT